MKRRELRVTRNKQSYAFSAGEIVESLQGAGVPTDEAISIARSIEKHYRNDGAKRIKLDKLVSRIAKTLENEIDKDTAERFRIQTPPFIPLEILQKDDAILPFSRRVLAKSLEKLGLRFKEAYAVAGQIEQSLRSKGYEFVSELELAHLVALALEARFGRDLRIKFEAQSEGSAEIQVVEKSGVSFPFSRGILARSLMAIGLGPDQSYAFSKNIENVLVHKGLTQVSRNALHEEVGAFLQEEAGDEFARRFELMRAVRQPDKPIIILIGGAAGVGKSALAAELNFRLGIGRIVSSDAIREALRSLITPQLSPGLHRSSYTAWRSDLLPSEQTTVKPKPKRVTRGFLAQAQQLSTALTAIVERSVQETTSVIIEGIHLVPGLLPLGDYDNVTLLEIVLGIDDEERHKSHFKARNKQTQGRRDEQAYLEHFSEIRMIHAFLRKRAENEGVPVINSGNFDEAIDRVLELILDASLSRAEPALASSTPDAAKESAEALGA